MNLMLRIFTNEYVYDMNLPFNNVKDHVRHLSSYYMIKNILIYDHHTRLRSKSQNFVFCQEILHVSCNLIFQNFLFILINTFQLFNTF